MRTASPSDIAPEALRGVRRLVMTNVSADQVRGLWNGTSGAAAIETQFGAVPARRRRARSGGRGGIQPSDSEPPPKSWSVLYSPELSPRVSSTPEHPGACSTLLRRTRSRVADRSDLGHQKVFWHYPRDRGGAASEGHEWSDHVSAFRIANAAVETRLRTKLPEWMKQIDALYSELGARPAPC